MATRPRVERPPESPPPHDDLAAVANAVEAALPGLDVLDRALVFDDGARADLAGVDASGHLVLVQLAALEGDRATLEALDLFALARRSPELFARHLRSTKIVAHLDPRVLVIFEPADARLASRLTALAGAGLELFELRTVRSATGERSYLLPRSTGGVHLPGLDAGPSLERFLQSLPQERQDLGRSLCERLARLDDDLATEVATESVGWYFQERLLVRLEARGARLRGAVGPRGVLRDLDSGRDGDELLEEALSRLVEEVGQARVEEDRAEAETAARREPIALLTAEELDAFRD
jgi:hypothetical protein